MGIRETDKFFIDENNNKFSKSKFLRETIEQFSKTLINCIDCIDCYNCVNCIKCENCKDCINSIGCKWCIKCINCIDCDTYEHSINNQYVNHIFK